MATTHFPTQAVLKEYNDSAVLNITKENQEADVYWVTTDSGDSNFNVYVNLYKPCLVERYRQYYGETELKLKNIFYANSFSLDYKISPDADADILKEWAKVYL